MDCMSQQADLPYSASICCSGALKVPARKTVSTPLTDVIDNVERLRTTPIEAHSQACRATASGLTAALQDRITGSELYVLLSLFLTLRHISFLLWPGVGPFHQITVDRLYSINIFVGV